jgi:chromosome transmission fidelity protein 4
VLSRLLRETIVLGWMRDALGPSLSSEELSTRELEMDKDLIKLLQLAIKDRHLQRAHDIVKLLHHISSLDTAMKLAEYYHLVGLQDKIKIWKAWREDNDDPSEEREERRDWERGVRPLYPPGELVGHLLGGSGTGGRPQDFRPAPMFPRRGLGNAIPSYGQSVFAKKAEVMSSQFTKSGGPTQQQTDYGEESYGDTSMGAGELDSFDYSAAANTPSPPAEGKRKRAAEDEDGEESYPAIAKKPRTSAQSRSAAGARSQGTSAPAMAPPANPLVRKTAAVPANAKPNPFARSLAPTKSMVKSNTFFEKVDAAEATGPVKKGEF